MRSRYADGIIFFCSFISLACAATSGPATFNFTSLFHQDGSMIGLIAGIAFFLVLETGAIGSKLATIWVEDMTTELNALCIFLLSLVVMANFFSGEAVFGQAQLSAEISWIREVTWTRYIAVGIFAALVPIIQWIFLSILVKRVKKLRGDSSYITRQVESLMQPVSLMAEQFTLMIQSFRKMSSEYGAMKVLISDLQGADEIQQFLPEAASDSVAITEDRTNSKYKCQRCGGNLDTKKAWYRSKNHGCPECV
jgi:hypothetical protein